MFQWDYNDEDGDFAYYREKLPNGQTITIKFQEECHQNYVSYNVVLFIKTKKKDRSWDYNKQTGDKLGIKGLLWAKDKLLEFEKYIIKKDSNKIIITVWWEDNRRKKVYMRGLKNVGYKYERFGNVMCLVKRLNVED